MEPTDWLTAMDALNATFAEDNPMDTVTIHLGARTLDVAVARTPEQWAQGMIEHPDLDAMLFVLPSGSQLPFHMRNVDRDLVVAFFDDAGTMVDRATLSAQVGFKRPSAPYTYALELATTIDDSILSELEAGLRFG